MKRVSPAGLIAICGFLVGTGTAQALGTAPVEDLVAQALSQNVRIEALQEQVKALEQSAIRAGAWEDPMLTVGYQNVPANSFALGEEPMSMLAVRVGLRIPFFGKTGRRESVANLATEAARWDTEEERVQVRSLVRRLYYQLALTRQLRTLTADHVGLVEQLLDAVRIKYEVGQADQHDLLRLEVLRDRLADDLNDYDAEGRQLTAALNETLHRDPAVAIETPLELPIPAPPSSADALRDIAVQNRPALRRLDSVISQQQAAADLARYEAFPDPTLFAQYGARAELDNGLGGRDLITVGLSWKIPVFYGSRNRAPAHSAEARARSAESRRAGMLDAIGSGLEHNLAAWERALQKIEVYRDSLVPDAHQALDATFTAYQVDRAGFLSLFEAELDLLNFEKTLRIAVVDALVAEAKVEAITGKEIS